MLFIVSQNSVHNSVRRCIIVDLRGHLHRKLPRAFISKFHSFNCLPFQGPCDNLYTYSFRFYSPLTRYMALAGNFYSRMDSKENVVEIRCMRIESRMPRNDVTWTTYSSPQTERFHASISFLNCPYQVTISPHSENYPLVFSKHLNPQLCSQDGPKSQGWNEDGS